MTPGVVCLWQASSVALGQRLESKKGQWNEYIPSAANTDDANGCFAPHAGHLNRHYRSRKLLSRTTAVKIAPLSILPVRHLRRRNGLVAEGAHPWARSHPSRKCWNVLVAPSGRWFGQAGNRHWSRG